MQMGNPASSRDGSGILRLLIRSGIGPGTSDMPNEPFTIVPLPHKPSALYSLFNKILSDVVGRLILRRVFLNLDFWNILWLCGFIIAIFQCLLFALFIFLRCAKSPKSLKLIFANIYTYNVVHEPTVHTDHHFSLYYLDWEGNFEVLGVKIYCELPRKFLRATDVFWLCIYLLVTTWNFK